MDASPAPTGAAPATAPARGGGLRIVAALALAALAGGGAWLALRPAKRPDDPVAMFDRARDGILAGDGKALWNLLLPRARESYAGFLRAMVKEEPKDQKTAAEYRRRLGVSREDLARLPAEDLFARECLAFAEDMYRGSRVAKTYPLGPDEALLRVNLRNLERIWLVERVDGAWKVADLTALVTMDGRFNRPAGDPRPGMDVPGWP